MRHHNAMLMSLRLERVFCATSQIFVGGSPYCDLIPASLISAPHLSSSAL